MILIANWKMQLGVAESQEAAKAILVGLPRKLPCEVVIAPSFESLGFIAPHVARREAVKLGAQDCFWQTKGPCTGEVSPAALHEIGCSHIIIGHSERRALGETDAVVTQKLRAVLEEGMTPILCIGESGDERREGKVHTVLDRELRTALGGASLAGSRRIIIAYEPIWAIGTGDAANPTDAAGALATITMILQDVLKPSLREKVSVIYGGSATHLNLAAFLRGGYDGALVGGASLRPKEFVAMVKGAIACV